MMELEGFKSSAGRACSEWCNKECEEKCEGVDCSEGFNADEEVRVFFSIELAKSLPSSSFVCFGGLSVCLSQCLL